MNSPFLSTHRLLLTPLSPIHIGCGVDYEPTNSVIDADRNFLYSFNLGLVGLLPQERRGLMTAVQNGVIEEINRFYARNIDIFRPWSSNIVPVSGKAVQKYRSMLSPKPQVKGGQKKTAQFAFQRLVFTRSEAGELPMIPGSSLKGMISTALKERINQLRSIGSKEEARLLGGDFDKSPMRFLKVGDMQLRTPQAATRLYYADRVHKKDAEPLGIGNGFEAVVPGFCRQFEGEVVLTSGQNALGIEKVYKTVTEILKDLHAYSMLVLLSQTFFYSKAAPAWLESIMKLLAELKPQFESGRLALVRLGKNTGAESKTIHMPDDAPDALPGRFKTGASTAYITSDADEKFGAQPFGWAILEADPAGDVQALKEWCARHACEELPAALSKEWQFIADLRAERKALLDKTAAEEADLIRRRQEAEKAEEAAQRAKAAMSPERRAAVEICEALAKFPGIVQPGTLLFDRVKLLLEEALSWTNAEDKKQLALQIQPLMKKKDMYRGKAERLFKSQLKTLRGEG